MSNKPTLLLLIHLLGGTRLQKAVERSHLHNVESGMKKTLRVLLAVVACAFVTAVGYFWGRRDGMLAEEKSLLIQSSLTAQLIRENHSDLVLQMAEQQMDYVALGLKRAGRVPDPAVICEDATTRGFYQNRPFWRASEYINHYPHPNVSASAIAYIQAQPESKN